MRGFRDRDFIESIEGLFFCVIGNIHPRDRVIAYLKYVPQLKSTIRVKWSRHGVMYGRILPYYSAMGVGKTMEFLKEHYSSYVVFDRYKSIEMIEVPRDRVKHHYRPEERLMEIFAEPTDPLEELAKELVSKLSSEARVSLSNFGITGSLLLKIHNLAYSDIDVIVYGRTSSLKLREALKKLYSDENSGFSLPKGDVLEAWASDIIKIHSLTLREAMLLYSKYKWNRGLYKNRQFSVHPVKLEHEVSEEWEQKVHKPLGVVEVRARVIDSSDSIFMPATYLVENAKVIEGTKPTKPLIKIVSYEGLYIDLAEPGDEVIARGKLEEVEDRVTGEEFCQVTIGTFEAGGRDYLKPLKWFSQ
ncbi:MAG: hypothetical protein N3E36_00110 [Sulfolobales archaeon]|nr:hypothetical protein [Sulfolobales archaeon]MCX8198431.1 hypothetical protein [Sulfolobales archaeon]MDW8169505.1 hypothetical protein [Desulfurococcaceae archaeon]